MTTRQGGNLPAEQCWAPASDTNQWQSSHDSNRSDTDGRARRLRAVDNVLDDPGSVTVNSDGSARGKVAGTVEAMTPPPTPLVACHGTLRTVQGRVPVCCWFARTRRTSAAPSRRRCTALPTGWQSPSAISELPFPLQVPGTSNLSRIRVGRQCGYSKQA